MADELDEQKVFLKWAESVAFLQKAGLLRGLPKLDSHP